MPKVAMILACSLGALVFSVGAQAFPGTLAPRQAPSDVVAVRGSCAPGFHHGAYGACVGNDVPTRLVVTPREGPVWPRVYCPSYGQYYSERYGRCVPTQ
jgi:hypothetical protein